ncbi:MAG: lipopolysaccharide heptosyltransferase I [Magnetococcales bacterium]|nr:lipopolysaccharide heptosyltransferase I [Magnetococcales bacterium]
MTVNLLLIKTSSLGDVLHMLPAVTDAKRACPDLRLSWVVEENLAEMVGWHPGVDHIIPVALRRWRRSPMQAWRRGELQQFLTRMRGEEFTHIVDAQGLLKSAILARLAQGRRFGPDRTWVRERYALPFYQTTVAAAGLDHVVARLRHLLAEVLAYPLPATPPDFGLDRHRLPVLARPEHPYVVFLHGTAWSSKAWPEACWIDLARHIRTQTHFHIWLPWGTLQERQRAERMATATGHGVWVLPALRLGELAAHLLGAAAVVGLDSGLAHLAGALDIPGITLFGATNPDYSGVARSRQTLLAADFPCAPCMRRVCHPPPGIHPGHPPCLATLAPQRVWEALQPGLGLPLPGEKLEPRAWLAPS